MTNFKLLVAFVTVGLLSIDIYMLHSWSWLEEVKYWKIKIGWVNNKWLSFKVFSLVILTAQSCAVSLFLTVPIGKVRWPEF